MWSGLDRVARLSGGHRNESWLARWRGEEVILRRSRRTPTSLQWELDLLDHLDRNGFAVPTAVADDDGQRVDPDGWSLHRFVAGDPPASTRNWRAAAKEPARLHELTIGWPQRPGCCTVLELPERRRSVDADCDLVPPDIRAACFIALAELDGGPVAVVHGDPGRDNLRVDSSGRVGLIDWDESRVDVVDLDFAGLGVRVLDPERQRAAECAVDASEVLNGWVVEPAYARRRADALLRSLGDAPG